MSVRGGSWRASLRIARRDAWRHKSRTALVVTLIAVPVAAMAYADISFRTLQGTPAAQVSSRIGTAADAWIATPGVKKFIQGPPPNGGVYVGAKLLGAPATLHQLVPDLRSALPVRWQWSDGSIMATTPIAAVPVATVELDYTDPLAKGLFTQLSGRAPKAADEVVVSRALADALSLHLGSAFKVAGQTYRVVGTVLPYYHRDVTVVGRLTAFPQVKFTSDATNIQAPIGIGWLVSTIKPVTYTDQLRINALGSGVDSRYVAENPPNACSPLVPEQVRMCFSAPLVTPQRAQAVALLGLVIGMALLQVVLIVGPAFAIGRRRQARDLAMVAAVGGDHKAVRRVVLSGGVVMGLLGGLAGLLVGLLFFYVTLPLVEDIAARSISTAIVRPELMVLVVVALVTGVSAAWLPARTASKQDVVAALAGRRGAVHSTRPHVLFGGVAVLIGISIAVFGTRPHASQLMLLGCVIAELGLVALTPAIMSAVSGLAARFPTSPRYAMRDGGRNRGRAGTAAAAVLAAVGLATGVAVYTASQSAAGAKHFVPEVPLGYVYLYPNLGSPLTRAPDVSRIAHVLPTRSVVTLSGLTIDTDPAQGWAPVCQTGFCAGGWKFEIPPDVRTQCTPGMDYAAWPCSQGYGAPWSVVLVGDATTYHAITGVTLPATPAAQLASGKALVSGDFTHYIDQRGFIRMSRLHGTRSVELPAVAVNGQSSEVAGRYLALISRNLAAKLGLAATPQGVMVLTTRPPTSAELARATSQAAITTPALTALAGAPFVSPSDSPLLLILLAAVALAILATSVATSLANADALPDFATMAAVGAGPRTRRIVAASSAALVAVVGTLLGAIAGLVVGAVATHGTFDPYVPRFDSGASTVAPRLSVAVPWSHLAGLWIVVPLIAVGLAFVFTRGRLPMVRRLT